METATNPETGERIYKDVSGQWLPLETASNPETGERIYRDAEGAWQPMPAAPSAAPSAQNPRPPRGVFADTFADLSDLFNASIDEVGSVAKRINRGLINLPDAPANLVNMVMDAAGAPEQYRAPTIRGALDNTPLDMRLNDTNQQSMIEQSGVGPYLETASELAPAMLPINTGSRIANAGLDMFGIGKPSIPVDAGALPPPPSPQGTVADSLFNRVLPDPRATPGHTQSIQDGLELARNGSDDVTQAVQGQLPRGTGQGSANIMPSMQSTTDIPLVPSAVQDQSATLLATRFMEPGHISMLKGASPETRSKMVEMVNAAQRWAANPSIMETPRDVMGELIGQRANALSDRVSALGSEIGSEVKRLRDNPVDASPLFDRLSDSLNNLRVGMDVDDAGKIVLDFSDSKLEGLPGAQQSLTSMVNRLSRYSDGTTFGQLHDTKQWASEMANYEGREVGTAGVLDGLIKNVRSGINDTLRSADGAEAYAAANDKFAAAVGPFRDIAKLAGKDVFDFESPQAIAELARKARGLTNNTAQGVKLNTALEGIDAQLVNQLDSMTPEQIAELGIDPKAGQFLTNLNELAAFAPTLDSLYNLKPTSFQGLTRDSAEAGADRAFGLLAEATTPGGNLVTQAVKGGFNGLKGLIQDPVDAAWKQKKSALEQRDKVVQALIEILER